MANLHYWHQQVSQFTDADMHQFQLEQTNVQLAIKLGLALPAAYTAAAELLLLSFPLIERGGFWQKWVALFQQAAAVLPSERAILRCKMLNRLGQLHRLLRRLDRAIEIHEKAAMVAQTCGDMQIVAEIFFNLSADYRQRRDYVQAETYGKQALEIYDTLPDCAYGQASALGTLGLIALNRNDLDLAEAKLRQSLNIWRQLDNPTEQARMYNGLAVTLQRKKQFEAALYFYQEALTRLVATSMERDKVEVYLNLGALHFEQEQYNKAEMFFRQANATLLRASGNLYLQAVLAQSLGNSLFKQQQLSEAESHLRHGYMLWQQLGDNLNIANTAGTLGGVLAERELYTDALVFYDEALLLLTGFPENARAKRLRCDFTSEREAVVQMLANAIVTN